MKKSAITIVLFAITLLSLASCKPEVNCPTNNVGINICDPSNHGDPKPGSIKPVYLPD